MDRARPIPCRNPPRGPRCVSANPAPSTAIPFAAAVLARSEHRTGTAKRTAADACAQAWTRAVHCGDSALAELARYELAAACRASRDIAQTRRIYQVLVELFADLPDERGLAEYDLAVLLSEAWQRGDDIPAEEAIAHFNRASTMFAVDGDTATLARLHADRAIHEFASGDTASAVMSLEYALERWRILDNEVQTAETLLTLGDCLDAADQPGAAIRRYREAETHFRTLGDGLSANAAAVRAELIAQRHTESGSIIDLRDHA